jgi:hypothetical protein
VTPAADQHILKNSGKVLAYVPLFNTKIPIADGGGANGGKGFCKNIDHPTGLQEAARRSLQAGWEEGDQVSVSGTRCHILHR